MIRFRLTWLMLFATSCILLLVNCQSWQPGVGGAIRGVMLGTRLERFFGWPATYRAEFWRSDDGELASRILAVAPFYYPGEEMSLEQRKLGIGALAVDVAFGLLVLCSVALIVESALDRVWSGRRAFLLVVFGLFMLVLWGVSPHLSVSL